MACLSKLRWLRSSLITAVLTSLTVACGNPEVQSFTRAHSIVGDPDTLVVSTEPAFPPFVYLNSEGQLVGFDVDLMNEIAQRLDLKVHYAYIPFDGLIATLEAETADASIDAMTITPTRAKMIDFSRPYFKSGLAIAIRDDRTDIKSLADLAGKKIAVKFGTTGADLAGQVPNTQLITFDSAEKALIDLQKGNVDAVIKDAPTTLGMLEKTGITNIRILTPLLTEELYGIGLPPQSGNKQFIDATLNAIIADGTYQQIYQKWFKADPPALPETAF